MVVIRTVPEQAALTSEYVAQLRTDIEGWLGNQSDPLYYAVEFIVQQQRIITELLNESGIALAVGLATGDDLTNIIPIPRHQLPPETDAEFRSRFAYLLQAHSGDTEDFIIRHVLTQTGILGAQVVRHAGYAVDIYVIGAEANTPGVPTATEIATANTYMNSTDIKPWFSTYTVKAATEGQYTVTGTLLLTPTAETDDVRERTNAALISAMSSLRQLNVGVYDSKLVELIWQPEFLDCNLTVTPSSPTEIEITGYTSQTDASALKAGEALVEGNNLHIYPRPVDVPFVQSLTVGQHLKINGGADNEITSIAINVLTNVATIELATAPTITGTNNFSYSIENNSLLPSQNRFYKGNIGSGVTEGTGWRVYQYGDQSAATYGPLVPNTP